MHIFVSIAVTYSTSWLCRYTWCLLMELMDGGPLTQLIRDAQSPPQHSSPQTPCPSSPDNDKSGTPNVHFPQTLSTAPRGYSDLEAVSWCLGLARALDYLHSQRPPIVHRGDWGGRGACLMVQPCAACFLSDTNTSPPTPKLSRTHRLLPALPHQITFITLHLGSLKLVA